MLSSIKNKQQQRLIRQLLGIGRKKRIPNMEEVRSMGIVFTVGDEAQWNTLYDYARGLSKQGKEVWLCGFQKKGITLNYIFSYTQSVICHEKTDLLFSGMPREGVLDNFTSRHFDLLLDLTEQPNFFGKYVALKTLADMKATYVDTRKEPDTEQEQIFDLLMRGDHPLDIGQFFTDINTYLSMIKK